jgi:Tol biopolymer transport system component
MPRLHHLALMLAISACGDGTGPVVEIPPHALAYVQDGDVYVIGLDSGAAAVKLASSFSLPTWSPDGGALGLVGIESNRGIFMLDVSDRSMRSLIARPGPQSEFGKPAWSPDGRTLLYNYRNRDSPNHSLYVIFRRVSADGSGGDFDPSDGIGGSISENPTWAPDGAHYAFDDQGQVYVANADGSSRRTLARGKHPAWSPDGQTVAFEVYESIGTFPQALRVIQADGADERVLTPPSASEDFEAAPAWSPDVRQIAFIHMTETPPSSVYMVMNADGSSRTVLAPGIVPDGAIVWSPDGEHLAFAGRATGESERKVYVIRKDGTELNAVASGDACCPDWRP